MKIIKSIPLKGIYFEESLVKNGNTSSEVEGNVINIYDDIKYQKIFGFGGAFTDSLSYLVNLCRIS